MARKTLQTLGALILLVAVALSGCLDDTGTTEEAEDTTSGDQGVGGNATANQTLPEAPTASVTVSGDNVTENGTTYEASVGANVTFDGSTSTGTNLTFAWDLGDGNTADGPNVTYTYEAEGNYTVNLTVTDEVGQTDTASVNLTITAAEAGADIQRQFEYEGVFLGCDPTALDGCVSMVLMGPDDDPIDGVWVPLGPAYEGLRVTTTVDNARADSDCFWLDADHATIGEAHNGAGPCEGEVPAGTAWLFLYSYAEPATHLTVDVLDA